MRGFFTHMLGIGQEEEERLDEIVVVEGALPVPKRTPQPGNAGSLHGTPALKVKMKRKSTAERQVGKERKLRERAASGTQTPPKNTTAPATRSTGRLSFTDLRGTQTPFNNASVHAVETKHSSKVMATFLEDHGKSEGAYATAMNKMARSAAHDLPEQDRGTTLEAAWTIFKSGWEREGSERREFGAMLREEASDLHAWRHKQMKTKKIIIAEGETMVHQLKAADAKFAATRAAYVKARDAAVALIKDRNEAFRVQGDKGQRKVATYAAKIEAKLVAVVAAKEHHIAASRELRETQLVYRSKVRSFLFFALSSRSFLFFALHVHFFSLSVHFFSLLFISFVCSLFLHFFCYRSKMLSLLSSFEALDVMRVQRQTGLFQSLAARERAATQREADLLRAVETTVSRIKPETDIHFFVSRHMVSLGGNQLRTCDVLARDDRGVGAGDDRSGAGGGGGARKTPKADVPIAVRDIFFEPYISALPELNEQLKAAMQMESASYGGEFMAARTYGELKPLPMAALPSLPADSDEAPPLPPSTHRGKTPRVPPRKTRRLRVFGGLRKRRGTVAGGGDAAPVVAAADFEFKIINVRKVPVRLGGAVDDALERAEERRRAPRVPASATKAAAAAATSGEARAKTAPGAARVDADAAFEVGGFANVAVKHVDVARGADATSVAAAGDDEPDAAALLCDDGGAEAPPALDDEDFADADALDLDLDAILASSALRRTAYARCLADFAASDAVEISMRSGDVVALDRCVDGDDWWLGSVAAPGVGDNLDASNASAAAPGEFPASYVELMWGAVALYDYAPEEEDDLAISEDDALVCCEPAGAGKGEWLFARNVRTGEQGLVPVTYVERV